MNLVKWTPWSDVTGFHNRINQLFDSAFFEGDRLEDGHRFSDWNPIVDVYDDDDKIIVKADLPGIDKKHINVDYKDGILTLKGERTHENEVKKENYYHRERSFGKFQRAFRMPEEIDADKIKADFKDGVLKIEIPKPEKKKPKKITVH